MTRYAAAVGADHDRLSGQRVGRAPLGGKGGKAVALELREPGDHGADQSGRQPITIRVPGAQSGQIGGLRAAGGHLPQHRVAQRDVQSQSNHDVSRSSGFGAQFDQDAAEFGAADYQIIGPLERSPGHTNLRHGAQGTDSNGQAERTDIPRQRRKGPTDGKAERPAGRCQPGTGAPATTRALVFRHQKIKPSQRRRLAQQKIAIGRARAPDALPAAQAGGYGPWQQFDDALALQQRRGRRQSIAPIRHRMYADTERAQCGDRLPDRTSANTAMPGQLGTRMHLPVRQQAVDALW